MSEPKETCFVMDKAEAIEETRHFCSVCWAFALYERDALLELRRIEKHLLALPPADVDLLTETITSRVSKLKNAISKNQSFLNSLLTCQDLDHFSFSFSTNDPETAKIIAEEVQKFPPQMRGLPPSPEEASEASCREVMDKDVSKVRNTLRQFVRDWSEESRDERDSSYGPLLEDLEKYVPVDGNREKPKVLTPGCGLGRLPYEVAKRGYFSQGNEFSYFMLMGSHMILNHRVDRNSICIHPYCLSTCNQKFHNGYLREVYIPDEDPWRTLPVNQDFSMLAGEFVEVYWLQKTSWDAVLTCFFLDTAKNVIAYVRTIHRMLRSGGLWANLGPLLYHYAETSDYSVELSWEELEIIISKYFDLKLVEWRCCYYTTNVASMMKVQYDCVHFVGLRKDD